MAGGRGEGGGVEAVGTTDPPKHTRPRHPHQSNSSPLLTFRVEWSQFITQPGQPRRSALGSRTEASNGGLESRIWGSIKRQAIINDDPATLCPPAEGIWRYFNPHAPTRPHTPPAYHPQGRPPHHARSTVITSRTYGRPSYWFTHAFSPLRPSLEM